MLISKEKKVLTNKKKKKQSFHWNGVLDKPRSYPGIWKLFKNKNCTPWKLYWFPFSSQSHNTGKWPQIQLHCIRALFSLHSTITSNFLMQTMSKKKPPLLHKNFNDSKQHLSVCSSYRLKKTPTKQQEAATAYRKVQSSQRLIYSYKGQLPLGLKIYLVSGFSRCTFRTPPTLPPSILMTEGSVTNEETFKPLWPYPHQGWRT